MKKADHTYYYNEQKKVFILNSLTSWFTKEFSSKEELKKFIKENNIILDKVI